MENNKISYIVNCAPAEVECKFESTGIEYFKLQSDEEQVSFFDNDISIR